MWIKVEDTRNLDSTLRRLSASIDGEIEELDIEEEVDVDEVTEKPAKQSAKKKVEALNKNKLARKIAWVLLIGLILALIGLVCANAYITQEAKLLNEIADPRLVLYENQIYTVKRLGYLFSIYDDESYQFARSQIVMTEDLKEQYFPTKLYHGKSEPEITVTIQDIRYEITEDTAVNYLVYLTRETPTSFRQYTLMATYEGEVLTRLQVLN